MYVCVAFFFGCKWDQWIWLIPVAETHNGGLHFRHPRTVKPKILPVLPKNTGRNGGVRGCLRGLIMSPGKSSDAASGRSPCHRYHRTIQTEF